MSSDCNPCASRNDRWIRHHTKNIITNDDARTNLITFNKHKVVYRMSIAKAKYSDTEAGTIYGYFQQTYGSSTESVNIPSCANTVIAFSGWVDPSNSSTYQNPLALANLQYSTLQAPNKYVTLGGGNTTITNTLLTTTYLTYFNQKMFTTPSGSQYTGIVFDVENIDNSVPIQTLINSFISVFQAAKNNGYTVMVTVGHDGYGSIPSLMPTFLSSPYIDYLIPQLYYNGDCSDNPLLQTNTVWPNTNWSSWVGAKPKIVAGITFEPLYCQAQQFFQSLPTPITLSGYIVWNNATLWAPGTPTPC